MKLHTYPEGKKPTTVTSNCRNWDPSHPVIFFHTPSGDPGDHVFLLQVFTYALKRNNEKVSLLQYNRWGHLYSYFWAYRKVSFSTYRDQYLGFGSSSASTRKLSHHLPTFFLEHLTLSQDLTSSYTPYLCLPRPYVCTEKCEPSEKLTSGPSSIGA
jgi:hypothetical protein